MGAAKQTGESTGQFKHPTNNNIITKKPRIFIHKTSPALKQKSFSPGKKLVARFWQEGSLLRDNNNNNNNNSNCYLSISIYLNMHTDITTLLSCYSWYGSSICRLGPSDIKFQTMADVRRVKSLV